MKQSPLLICAFVLLTTSLALVVPVGMTQDIEGPVTYTEPLQKSVTNAKPHVVQRRANGKVQAAYFSNWYFSCCLESPHSGC